MDGARDGANAKEIVADDTDEIHANVGDDDDKRAESTRLFSEMKEMGVDKDSPDGRIMHGYVSKGGDPYQFDPEFKGPLHDRSCTDIICCFIFVIFMLGMVIVSIIGFARGDPKRLIYPTDSFGDICGHGKYEDKPYLFFFDLNVCAQSGAKVVATGCPTPQVCVKECPKENYVYLEAMDNDDRSKLICRYHVDHQKSPYKEMSVKKLVEDELCAAYYVKSGSVVHRCVPSMFSEALGSVAPVKDASGKYQLESPMGDKISVGSVYNGTKSLLDLFELTGTMEMVFKDIVQSAHWIIVCLVLAALVAMLWIVLLRWVTFIMVWFTILFFVILIGFVSVYSYIQYYQMKAMNVTHENDVPAEFKLDLDYYLSHQTTWLAIGCTTATLFIIFMIIVFFLCGRISLAVNLISEASVALSHMWTVLLWPIFPFVLEFLIIVYWIFSSLYIVSMGEAEFYNDTVAASSNDVNALLNRVPCDHADEMKELIRLGKVNGTFDELCTFVKYGGAKYKEFMLWYQLFMFFWLMNFVSAMEQMTLAGSFATYYWTWDKKNDMPTFPLLNSLLRNLRYHVGSLAFGSLIISIVQLIRAILEYIHRKLKPSENKVAKFILKCLGCCFWCLEKFLRFVNKNAYIIIAIHGNNFCSAAKDGFFLVMRNILRAAVLDKVCDFIMFVSKVIVAALIGVASYFWFRDDADYFEGIVPKLNYFFVPVIVVVIGAYIIADCFFDVYSMGVDTLFLCFLEDLERNDGSQERPYYMSKTENLRHLLFEPK